MPPRPLAAAGREERILLTWVGARDPSWTNPTTRKEEPGPILSLLRDLPFDIVYLLFNLDSDKEDFPKRATDVLRLCQRYFPAVRVLQKPIDLYSVIDHAAIYRATNDVCQRILKEEGTEGKRYYVFLSPGTPPMHAVWVLLVQSGLVPATMLQGTPPDRAKPGAPRVREVDLSLPYFPQIVSPGETARELGIRDARIEALGLENLELRAQLESCQATQTGSAALDGIERDFSLRTHLDAQERALYARALAQAGGDATEAAHLLGLKPHTFRARAATFGLRPRAQRDGRTTA
jgi:hypothetical protein